jgi:head-tail adaptor
VTVKGAGDLRERVTFQRRGELSDGFGNEVTGDWADQFTVAARVQARLGGEEVVASRLAGVQPLILTVRSSSQTRQVTSGWRAYDARAGINADGEPKRLFNIRSSANVDERNAFIDFLVSEGQPG